MGRNFYSRQGLLRHWYSHKWKPTSSRRSLREYLRSMVSWDLSDFPPIGCVVMSSERAMPKLIFLASAQGARMADLTLPRTKLGAVWIHSHIMQHREWIGSEAERIAQCILCESASCQKSKQSITSGFWTLKLNNFAVQVYSYEIYGS